MKNVERICSFWLANELVLAKMVLILRINVGYCNMNIEDFREYCLSFKGTNEKMPFEKASSAYDRNLLVFSVFDKWFCFVNIDEFDFCNLKCDPEESEELRERYEEVRAGYHMNKRLWISVDFNRDVPDGKIKELVRKSYEAVVVTLPKKEREALDKL